MTQPSMYYCKRAVLVVTLLVPLCLHTSLAMGLTADQLDPEMQRKIAEELKNRPAVPEGQDPTKIPVDLHDAVLDEDLHLMQAIMHHGGEINQIGQGGQTPLIHAAMHGKALSVGWLLAHGADASIPEDNGYTAMHAAAFAGKPEVIKALLTHGLSPNERLKDGLTPIHRACWGKELEHTEVVRLLLHAGVPHDQPTSSGHKPIELAAGIGKNEATVKLLQKWAYNEANGKTKKAKSKKQKQEAPKAEL